MAALALRTRSIASLALPPSVVTSLNMRRSSELLPESTM